LLGRVNDILDFTRMEAHKVVFCYSDFDLISLVDNVMDMFSEVAAAKDLDLINVLNLPKIWYPARVYTDGGRLQQVLINLLNNAVKFTHKGRVALTVSCQGRGEEVDKARVGGNLLSARPPPSPRRFGATTPRASASDIFMIRFEVADTGIGIAPEDINRLFQSFSQVENSFNRSYDGTGLGLAITKHLVELASGTCGVTSKRGEGSTFWFTWGCFPTSGGGPSPRLCLSPPPSPPLPSLSDLTGNKEVPTPSFPLLLVY